MVKVMINVSLCDTPRHAPSHWYSAYNFLISYRQDRVADECLRGEHHHAGARQYYFTEGTMILCNEQSFLLNSSCMYVA